jgi:hypothetical protein
MNEQIKLLAQCNQRIQNFFETGPVQRAAIEEFAQLIIRECAIIANAGVDPAESHLPGDDILENFGVEL